MCRRQVSQGEGGTRCSALPLPFLRVLEQGTIPTGGEVNNCASYSCAPSLQLHAWSPPCPPFDASSGAGRRRGREGGVSLPGVLRSRAAVRLGGCRRDDCRGAGCISPSSRSPRVRLVSSIQGQGRWGNLVCRLLSSPSDFPSTQRRVTGNAGCPGHGSSGPCTSIITSSICLEPNVVAPRNSSAVPGLWQLCPYPASPHTHRC